MIQRYTLESVDFLARSSARELEGILPMLEPKLQEDTLLTFKEAMSFLRVSRSTLYRLMWSGQLCGHKVGSTWRFYKHDLRSVVASSPMSHSVQQLPVGTFSHHSIE
jgi:excisionase family DNA binding protein